jgi:hypothetical protein
METAEPTLARDVHPAGHVGLMLLESPLVRRQAGRPRYAPVKSTARGRAPLVGVAVIEMPI